jgi:hypothetical protein
MREVNHPTRLRAMQATRDAYWDTPQADDYHDGSREELLGAARAAHESNTIAMQFWADEALAAADEDDRMFCQFLADAHERERDDWLDVIEEQDPI